MNTFVRAVVVVGLGLFLLGMSHRGGVDADAWVDGLRGFGEVMNAGNIDALVAGWTEDSLRIHPMMGEVKGQEGQREFFQWIYDNFRDQNLEVHRYAANGNLIVTEWTWSGTHRESGKRVVLDELAWFELDGDGRIKRMRQYFDPAKFNKQLE